ncbi:hypothetical protein QYE76_049012 [Lolium multiflorum]|uniref:Uncharacterized protein n=1 Tax=Lolium multiflorum TaxID=4521 RepID=A0AAD8SM51_LOLMU|nr:hypothetical protein QYE76_049012 [Lolium multiflorum]
MPRSSSTSATSSRRPILGRAMAILTTLPLTPISKARAARTLLLFKRRRAAAARRLRHYSYAYVGEYQFSPSGSPLLLPRPPGLSAWRTATGSKRRGGRARAVLASIFCCAGGDALDVAVLDGLPPLPLPQDDGAYDGEVYGEVHEEEEYDEDQDEEVDSRAERFIERFYQEMRMQETQRLLI